MARKCLIISSFKNQGGPDANQLPLTDSKKLPFCIGFNKESSILGVTFFSAFGPTAAWLAAPRPGTPGRPGQTHQGGQGGGEAREARPGPRVARKCLIISSFKNQGGPDANQLPLTDSKKLPFCIGFIKESSILGPIFFGECWAPRCTRMYMHKDSHTNYLQGSQLIH